MQQDCQIEDQKGREIEDQMAQKKLGPKGTPGAADIDGTIKSKSKDSDLPQTGSFDADGHVK